MAYFFYLTPQILLPFSPLTPQEFDLIRRKAGASWRNETRWSDSSLTTYSGSYRKKERDKSTCGRFPLEAGQHRPECHQMSSPKGSAYNPTLSKAGPQGTPGVKGLFPHITSSFEKPLSVKHRVAHQILFGDFSPAPPNYGSPYGRTKRPTFQSLLSYNQKREDFWKHPPELRSSASKSGSSENSDADQYYVYGLGGPLWPSS
ncbi:uncharacterized protein C4orf51 homolog [Molossus nigricans]